MYKNVVCPIKQTSLVAAIHRISHVCIPISIMATGTRIDSYGTPSISIHYFRRRCFGQAYIYAYIVVHMVQNNHVVVVIAYCLYYQPVVR